MAPLAEAFVRLRSDSTLLGVEATRDAAKAGDKAGAVMGRSMSSGMSRTFKAVAGIGAATGLVELGRKVFELADQFEGARARVEQNTQNIGSSFNAIAKPLDELDAKMATLGFTMSDTESNFATLEAATRNPAKAMQDMALAADIARGRNQSLSEVTSILARVETGHVSQLGRLGIALKDSAGHTMTAKQALQQLTELYGGNAARFAETLAGKQEAANAEMQRAGVEIGTALLPALVDLANVVTHDVLPPIVSTAQFFERNRKVIEPLVKTGVELTLMWKGYTLAAKAAGAMSKYVGEQSLFATGALLKEGAAGEKAAIGLTTEARAATLAGRAARIAPGALGVAALFASGATHGTTSKVLAGAGTGALLGGVIGPEGALIGAGFGALLSGLSGGPSTKDRLTKQATSSAQGYADVQSYLAQKTRALAAAQRDGTDTTAGGIKKQIELAQAALKTADGQNKAKKAVDALNRAMAAQAQVAGADARNLVAVSGAQDGLRAAMHAAAQTAADNGRTLTGNSDTALANRDALRGEADAIFAVVDAMKANNASATEQKNTLAILERALETNATKTYGDKDAVDALLQSLGLIPAAVNVAAQALAALPAAQQTLLNSDTPSKGAIQQLNQQVAKVKQAGEKLGESFTAGYTPVVSKAAEKAAKTAAKAVSDAFAQAKQKMMTDLDTIRQAMASTQQQIAGFADFTAQGTDALGASGLNTDVTGQLKAKAAQLKTFATLFTRLDRMHLDPHLMAQFAQIGPDAIPAMQAIAASGARGVALDNRIESKIQGYSRQVARVETKEQESGLIHQDLLKLPPKLARAFATELKHLHIDVSLSEVDRKLGTKVVVSS